MVFVGAGGGPNNNNNNHNNNNMMSSDRSVMSEMIPSSHSRQHQDGFSSYFPSDRSVLTEALHHQHGSASFEDDDMPMDEMQDTIQVMKGKASEVEMLRLEAAASKKEIERLHHMLQHHQPEKKNHLTIAQIDAADQGGGVGRGVSATTTTMLNRDAQQHRSMARSSDSNLIKDDDQEDDDDDVSSLGDAHDVLDDQVPLHSPKAPAAATTTNTAAAAPASTNMAPSLFRLTQAIRSSTRPANMTPAERELWHAVQSALSAARTDYSSRHRTLERQLQESTSQHDHIQLEQTSLQKKYQQAMKRVSSLETELKQTKAKTTPTTANEEVKRLEKKCQQLEKQYLEAHQLALSQQDEHERELRAIQRVLADISTHKDVEVEKMNVKLKKLMTEKEELQHQLDQQAASDTTTREMEVPTTTPEETDARQQIKSLNEEMEDLRNLLQDAVAERDAANQELERKSVKMSALERDMRSAKVNMTAAATAAAEAAVLEKLKKELEAANEQVKQLQGRVEENANLDDLRTLLQETTTARDAAQQELERKTTKLISVERELRAVKAKATVATTKSKSLDADALEQARTDLTTALKEIDQLKIREKDLAADVEAKGKQIRTLRRQINAVRNTKEGSSASTTTNATETAALEDELARVRSDLQEKESSLENAKMIIASLENANGLLAVDLRAKLRNKDDELTAMHSEAADRKRTIDSLALELRDLQCKNVTFDPNVEIRSKRQIERHRDLSSQLEKSLSELQSALVVHEAATESVGTADDPVIQQISDILCQSLAIVKASLEVYDLPDENMELESTFSSYVGTDLTLSSEVGRQVEAMIRDDREAAAKELRQELESKNGSFKRLEEAMNKQADEIKKLRQEYDRLKGEKDSEEERLYAEMRNLRDQCMTNMEVLTKKERELEVLRDSLKVDDGVGYISDDGSDDGDEGVSPNHAPSPPRISSSLQYGPSQAEALATLLVHGGGASVSKVPEGSPSTEEVEKLRAELAKAHLEMEKLSRELRAERDSLANAKMIISSLEKANKSMMEDLRKRLQDSTTAIAALVDKSMENEKVSNELRKEMEQVKREREDERVKFKTDLKKFKDELLVANLRIAAKDKELDELRKTKADHLKELGVLSSSAAATAAAEAAAEIAINKALEAVELTQTFSTNNEILRPPEEDQSPPPLEPELDFGTEAIDGIPTSQDDNHEDSSETCKADPI